MNVKEMLNDKKNLNIILRFKEVYKQEIKGNSFVVDQIFECIKDLYLFFKDEIDIIPKEDDPYNYFIFCWK